MQSVSIPWSAWYDTRTLDLTFPDSWKVTVADMVGGTDIGDDGIREALASPIGSRPLRQLAAGRSSAAILIDDLSRPTPSFRLIPYLLEELAQAGIPEDRVRVISALAAHRPLTRDDFLKKVGPDLVDRLHVINHNAYENLDFLGHSSRGIPVWINRDLMACEVRIALGMITPRGSFFGGGSKLVLPGAAGHVTILANHRYIHEGFREHLAEVGKMAGLSFIVNPLLNPDLDVIGLVAGDPEAAYWEGVEIAKQVYATPAPEAVDVGIFNAFPKDTELMQAGMAMVPLNSTKKQIMNENATAVIASASPEGLGWHSVFGPGCALRGKPGTPRWGGGIIFSPGCNRFDSAAIFGDAWVFCKTWPEVLRELESRHGAGSHAAVFPCSAMQYIGD